MSPNGTPAGLTQDLQFLLKRQAENGPERPAVVIGRRATKYE